MYHSELVGRIYTLAAWRGEIREDYLDLDLPIWMTWDEVKEISPGAMRNDAWPEPDKWFHGLNQLRRLRANDPE